MRRILASLCIASAMLVGGPAGAQQAPDANAAAPNKDQGTATPPASEKSGTAPAAANAQTILLPQPEALLSMIRSALVALDQANKTNNYAVMREFGGPELQKMSAAELSDKFAGLRTARIDLSPVTIVTPQLSEPPAITAQSLLNLVGYFPTRPLQARFQIVFQPFEGRWRLYGLNVNLVPAEVASADASKTPPDAAAKAPAKAEKTAAKAPAAKKK